MVIEALRMNGSGRLTVTGQLGDVMRESVDAAYSYVRSRAAQIGIPDAAFKDYDIHVHLPAGAIPKDGPSAGITLTLAIASALSYRPVRRDVAMTGEVTLRGKVLEIGGVKEKVLAAYRAGLRHLIMPKANEKDLRDVPDEVKKAVTFTFVERMDEVLRLALLPPVESDTAPPDDSRALGGSHTESATVVPVTTEPGALIPSVMSPDGPALDESALDEVADEAVTSPT
jgi:ATP-dependent Lon protease